MIARYDLSPCTTIWRSLPGFTPTRMAEPRLSALSGRACVVLCFCTEPTWADRLILFSPRIIFFCFVLRDDGISIRSIGKLPHCKGGFLSSAWQQQQPDPQGQRSKATLSPGGGSDGVATATALFFRNTEGEATSPDGTFGKHQSKHNSNFIKRRKGDDPHPPGACVKRPPTA